MPEVVINKLENGQVDGDFRDVMPDDMRFDPGFLRPFKSKAGEPLVTLNTWETKHRKDAEGNYICNKKTGEPIDFYVMKTHRIGDLMNRGISSPVWNATSLRLDEWKRIDDRVVTVARQRLKAWADLAARSQLSGFDGMGTTILEYETQSDPGSAVVDMSGLSEGNSDSPRYQLEGLPLPVTSSPFQYPKRQLASSRRRGQPLNISSSEASARRVAETLEQTLIGTTTGITYGGSTEYGRTASVYGYTNFPSRVTKIDMTVPTGTNGNAVHGSWIALREAMYAQNFFGPFMAYVSTDYDAFLDRVFDTNEPSAGTLRDFLLKIDGISAIKRLDYLTSTLTVVLVQMEQDVAQVVNGADIAVIQWESHGGWQLNFRVYTIQAPLLKADFDGNCGIGHGTTT